MQPAERAGRCLISVIIPCYLRADGVRRAVQSALDQDLDAESFEVLVVDSSPDETVAAVVEELRPRARCRLELFRKKPEGPGPSRNLGAANARGAYFAFLDSDCEATVAWLRSLLAAFDGDIGIVQGRTLPNPGKRQGVFSHTIRVESESFLYETANIAYQRACFEQAGGFMVDWSPLAITPLGGEDVDLAWRAKRKGWRSSFSHDALVYHDVAPMTVWSWIWIGRLRVFPWLVKTYPELRKFLFARYFYDKAQSLFVLALLGGALAGLGLYFVVLAAPYVYFRAAEPTRTLKGPLRLLRPAVYVLRDGASFLILLVSSLRSRTILL